MVFWLMIQAYLVCKPALILGLQHCGQKRIVYNWQQVNASIQIPVNAVRLLSSL